MLRACPKLILLLGKKVKLILISEKISCMIEIECLRNLKLAVNLVVET